MTVVSDPVKANVVTPNTTADDASTPIIEVRSLSKLYRRVDGTIVRAVNDVSLTVAAGQFVVLLGPSGCGKTTLLRCVAGLEEPNAGQILLRERTVFDGKTGQSVSTERRRLSMIFQSYALWPHMTAFDNVAYPLRARRVERRMIRPRVEQVLEMVGIPDLQRQYPSQMSGGQQQRVALARALVSNDDLVLFDEPLSNVDARVREQLRFELAEMQARLRFTALYVTHDQVEGLSLADSIAVMRSGSIEQMGSPREVYLAPVSRYVANFVGTTNEILGRVCERNADGSVLVDSGVGLIAATAGDEADVGDEVVVSCRPSQCKLQSGLDRAAERNALVGVLEAEMFVGSHTEYLVRVGDLAFRVLSAVDLDVMQGQECVLLLPQASTRALRV